MGSDVETNGGGIPPMAGQAEEVGASHPNFESIADTAEQLATDASEPGVRRLAMLMAKAMRTVIVVRGPRGEGGPPGERGERGAPGAPDLGPVGTDRERLQWAIKVLVEVEANAVAGDWSLRSRASLRDARQSLMKAIGAVASLDETGSAGAVRALDPSPSPSPRADEAPAVEERAAPRDRDHRDFVRHEREDREEKGKKRNRRNNLPVLGHGDIDDGN